MLEHDAMTKNAKAILDGLNPQQREAVLHDQGPLLVLAGAGSGKTKVITHRIAYLVEQRGVYPSQILAITFTNKAAQEMKDRINQLIGVASISMWVGTFHSMMARILRAHAERVGLTSNFTILDIDDQQRIIREGMKELLIDEHVLPLRTIQRQISAAKSELIDVDTYEKEAGQDATKRDIAYVYRRYQTYLEQTNCCDFDDLLLKTVELFENEDEVLTQYQERFRYVLVDEYQDTNHAQYRLVRLLTAKHRNLCVVGDDDQSIYSFRGANIRNILDFEHDFKGCKVIKLEQNYRSTGAILGAANAVIRKNEDRKHKRLWTDKPTGAPIVYYQSNNQVDEARYVANQIRSMHDRSVDPVLYSEIGILYRINALSRNVEFALREAGIPYRIYGGQRFYERKEIKDLMAYLRLIFTTSDDLSFLRAVAVPRRGIGDVTLQSMEAVASRAGSSLFDVALTAFDYPELSRAARKLQTFAQMIVSLRQTMLQDELSLVDFMKLVESQSGMIEDLEAQKQRGIQDAQTRIENLKVLFSDALEFGRQSMDEARQLAELPVELQMPEAERLPGLDASLQTQVQSFLERTALFSDQDSDDDGEAVRLMTIHSAKGLEFDNVFLIGAEDGIFPSYQTQDDPEALAEERRLAYVAITRARRELHITTALSRLIFGQTRYGMTSRFVRDIPDEFLRELGGSRHESNFGYINRQQSQQDSQSGHSPSGNRSGWKFSSAGKVSLLERNRVSVDHAAETQSRRA